MQLSEFYYTPDSRLVTLSNFPHLTVSMQMTTELHIFIGKLPLTVPFKSSKKNYSFGGEERKIKDEDRRMRMSRDEDGRVRRGG